MIYTTYKNPMPIGSQGRFSPLGDRLKGMKTGALRPSGRGKRRPRQRHQLEASASMRINPLDVLMRIDT